MTNLLHSELTLSQKAFIDAACTSIADASDSELAIYANGENSPNGERFAAVRSGSQFNVTFDFNEGRCYHTAVYLPVS
jgi:hypothetical protein